jgi:two-component system, NarL family, sensor histidine kinase NreB
MDGAIITMKPFNLENKYLQTIFESIQDGIIIMNHEREILLMNPAAKQMTGWLLHDSVPYCSFCEKRTLAEGENKCYLIAREEVPYFLSDMPTYHGKKINVEMSTALMYEDDESNQKEYLLVLRDQSVKRKKEEARVSKLMIQRLIEAKETEHKRLAQELHDGVGQSLYTISVALQAIESYVKDDRLQNYIDEVRNELDHVMNDIKAYSYQLRPQSLDRLGLIAAIQGLIITIEKSNPFVTIDFLSNIENRLPAAVEINLYRVIQEAMHNISKYAEAKHVAIQLMEYRYKIELLVMDDGKGFETKRIDERGLGLQHMEERLDQLEGSFVIESTLGKGTKIVASIPKGEGFL